MPAAHEQSQAPSPSLSGRLRDSAPRFDGSTFGSLLRPGESARGPGRYTPRNGSTKLAPPRKTALRETVVIAPESIQQSPPADSLGSLSRGQPQPFRLSLGHPRSAPGYESMTLYLHHQSSIRLGRSHQPRTAPRLMSAVRKGVETGRACPLTAFVQAFDVESSEEGTTVAVLCAEEESLVGCRFPVLCGGMGRVE
jgi:hypothetical protein